MCGHGRRNREQALAVDRTARGCGVGFGLGGALDGLAQEALRVVEDLDVDGAEVLIGGFEEAGDGGLQGGGQTKLTTGLGRRKLLANDPW
jgi:hypothetical protein